MENPVMGLMATETGPSGGPNCYRCIYRRSVPGDCHSACANLSTGPTIKGSMHGVRNGWFFWPFNFDPIWLEACGGFEPEQQKAPPIPEGTDGARCGDGD